MEELLIRLGRRIRELRIEKGFRSQEEFADYCKMHRTFLGHLETGRKDFRLTTIIRVAQALGVTMQDLFAGLESGEPFKSRPRRQQLDSQGILRELATVEQSVQRIKSLASHQRNPAVGKRLAGSRITRKRSS